MSRTTGRRGGSAFCPVEPTQAPGRARGKAAVPLVVVTDASRTDLARKVLQLCKEWGATALVGNIEHEADELWRDVTVVEQASRFGVHADFVDDVYW